MSQRDEEDLVLNTLRNRLATELTIPLAQIHIKRPAMEFVSKNEDTSTSVQFIPIYPAVSLNSMKDVTIKYNNYGDMKYIRSASGIVTAYQPLAEMEILLAVSLFTKSRKDQRDYGIILEKFFLQNKYLNLDGDIIQNEYFSLTYRSKKDLPSTDPFHKAYVIALSARILMEVTGYMIDEITTNISTTEPGNDVINPAISITTTYDPSNPLIVDELSEFVDGDFERSDSA